MLRGRCSSIHPSRPTPSSAPTLPELFLPRLRSPHRVSTDPSSLYPLYALSLLTHTEKTGGRGVKRLRLTSAAASHDQQRLTLLSPLDTSHSAASPLLPLDTRKRGYPPPRRFYFRTGRHLYT